EAVLRDITALLRTPGEEAAARLEKLLAQQRELERRIAELQGKLAGGASRDLLADARHVDGITVLATRVEGLDEKGMREMVDRVRDRIKSGVVVLGAADGERALLVAGVTRDLTSRYHAGNIIKQLAPLVGGGGGGRPDYAQRILSSDRNAKLRDIFLDTVFISAHKRVITPKSVAQKEYIDAIRNFDIVFGIGPAGTGKCVAGSSLVLTTRGLVPIAALGEGTAPGEYRPIDLEVASLSGRARASHVYNGGHSRTLRLRTRLGREIEVTPEHPLLRLRTDGVSVWQRAEELRTGDHVAVQRGQAMFGGDAAEITAIEEGEADVYDLTVPGSHSFCANGFVNHNT